MGVFYFEETILRFLRLSCHYIICHRNNGRTKWFGWYAWRLILAAFPCMIPSSELCSLMKSLSDVTLPFLCNSCLPKKIQDEGLLLCKRWLPLQIIFEQ